MEFVCVSAKHGLTLKWDLKTKSGLRVLIWSKHVFGREIEEKWDKRLGLGNY